MSVPGRALALGALLSVSASGVEGQTLVSLVGSVRDSAGAPVALARLTIGTLVAFSDSSGLFRFASLPQGLLTVGVRRLGFEPRDTLVEIITGRTTSLDLTLVTLPIELEGVTAEARLTHRMIEFERHRRSGEGYFFDRSQIEQTRASRLSDVLRRAPGVRIILDRAGRSHLRLGRTLPGQDCPPDFWVDGMRAQFLQVDDLPIIDIEAVELYHGPSRVPPEYNTRFGSPACGTIVIWSRTPPETK